MAVRETIVVGIDPSLSGCAVFTSHGEGKEWKSKKLGDDLRSRKKRYDDLLQAMAQFIGRTPSHIIIEGYLVHMKGNAIGLVEVGWHIRRGLLERFPKATIIEVPPTSLKKFVTGKGNADKVAVATALSKRYGRAFDSDNMADAFGLMKFGCVLLGREKPLAFQTEVYQKLGLV